MPACALLTFLRNRGSILISRLRGLLLTNDFSTVEVETSGGVVYEVEVPLTVVEHLPPIGTQVELRTVQVVREDSVSLFGFLEAHERDLFRRLLTASGVGAKLALAMLSTYSARRLAQALAWFRRGHRRFPRLWKGRYRRWYPSGTASLMLTGRCGKPWPKAGIQTWKS